MNNNFSFLEEEEMLHNCDETSVTSIDSYFKTSDPFFLLNMERAEIGIPVLTKSSSLANAARNHAMNMAKYDGLYYFATELLDTNNDDDSSRPLKEIVAYGKSVLDIHDMLLSLGYERSNMLSVGFTCVGVGIAKGTCDIYCACYLFC